MPFWTYALRSESTGRYYCGSTDDVARRVRQHNDPEYTGSKTTKRFMGPWVVVWKEEHPTRAEAMSRERQIKKRGIARFLADRDQLAESRHRRD